MSKIEKGKMYKICYAEKNHFLIVKVRNHYSKTGEILVKVIHDTDKGICRWGGKNKLLHSDWVDYEWREIEEHEVTLALLGE